MTKQKACTICNKIYEHNINSCPDCSSKEFSDNFKGRIIIINPEKSEITKKLKLSKKGEFAIKTR